MRIVRGERGVKSMTAEGIVVGWNNLSGFQVRPCFGKPFLMSECGECQRVNGGLDLRASDSQSP